MLVWLKRVASGGEISVRVICARDKEDEEGVKEQTQLEQYAEIAFPQSLLDKHYGDGLDIVVYKQRHRD